MKVRKKVENWCEKKKDEIEAQKRNNVKNGKVERNAKWSENFLMYYFVTCKQEH